MILVILTMNVLQNAAINPNPSALIKVYAMFHANQIWLANLRIQNPSLVAVMDIVRMV